MSGNTNRTKGHNAERHYAKEFRDLGFDKVQTARYGSRIHDDAGIDLINLPFNVQIKAGRQRGMNPSKVLSDIKERIPSLFMDNDPVHKNMNILIHKKEVGRGRPRNEFDELVHISFEDFKTLISMVNWNQE